MDYLALLQHSYAVEQTTSDNPPDSPLEYLSQYIFDFTTYDSEMSERFAAKAVEVCAAINDRQTFRYIEDAKQYQWYLLMCNMPFFAGQLDWGTSIRGAWWRHDDILFESDGLWVGDEQRLSWTFTGETWRQFITAIIAFARSTAQEG